MSRLAGIFVALVLALAVSPAHAQGWPWPWERPADRTYYVEWPGGGRIFEYRSTSGEPPRISLFPQSEPSPLSGWSGPVPPLAVPPSAPVNPGWLYPSNPQPAPAQRSPLDSLLLPNTSQPPRSPFDNGLSSEYPRRCSISESLFRPGC
jgi:hypothetical protein